MRTNEALHFHLLKNRCHPQNHEFDPLIVRSFKFYLKVQFHDQICDGYVNDLTVSQELDAVPARGYLSLMQPQALLTSYSFKSVHHVKWPSDS